LILFRFRYLATNYNKSYITVKNELVMSMMMVTVMIIPKIS